MLGVDSACEAVVWLPGLVRPPISQGLGHGCPSERAPNSAASVGAAWQGSRAQRPPRQALAQIAGLSGSDPAGWGGPRVVVYQGHSNAKAADLGATWSVLWEPSGLPLVPSMQVPPPLSAASGHSFLGKAQLYVTVNQAPRDVACQVQPHRGLEADTIFSVFCTSGRPVSTQTPSVLKDRPRLPLMKRWGCECPHPPNSVHLWLSQVPARRAHGRE